MYIAVAQNKRNPDLVIKQRYFDFDDLLEFHRHLGEDYDIVDIFDDTEQFKEVL